MKKYAVVMTLLYGLGIFSTVCEAGALNSTAAVDDIHSGSTRHNLDYDGQSKWHFTSGEMQSPVNINIDKTEKMREDGKIVLSYDSSITGAENNGHSVEVADSGTAIINKRYFKLVQFHFHAKSEHTINGHYFPLEAHFVNQSQDGRLAVIAVFFTEGKENPGFKEVLDDVNNNKSDPINNIQTMFPENKSYYHYLGSLTTPPLIENVEWYILKNPVEVSVKQIEEFKTLYSHNNRKIQKLNDRVVLSYDE